MLLMLAANCFAQYKLIDSLYKLQNNISSSYLIDGWYQQNISPSVSDPPDILPLSRGLGSMGNQFRLSNIAQLKKITAEINSDSVRSGIKVYLFKNGINTGLYVPLNLERSNTASFNNNTCTFRPKDYFDLRYSFEYVEGSYGTPDIQASVLLEYPHSQNETAIPDSAWLWRNVYRVSVEAVDSGGVSITPTKTTEGQFGSRYNSTGYYKFGDTVTIVSTPNSGWQHWCFTGYPDTWLNRSNDTIRVVITNNYNIKARYIKTKTKRVVISDTSSSNADSVRLAFKTGYVEDGWGVSEFADDSIAIVIGTLEDALKYADIVGAEFVIRGVNDLLSNVDIAQKYYPMQVVMPAHITVNKQVFNSRSELPSIITIGGGNMGSSQIGVQNRTGYDIEAWTYDPFSEVYPAPVNGAYAAAYFVGGIMGITDFESTSLYRNALIPDYYGMRRMLRYGCTGEDLIWTPQNGYVMAIMSNTVQDIITYTRYVQSTQYNTNYFRDTDPYLQR